MSRIWLMTGCSSGLGRAIAEAALAAGNKAVVTAGRCRGDRRRPSGTRPGSFPGRHGSGSVDEAVRTALEWGGSMDVLVNNAAYGLYGAVEEASDDEIFPLFDTNVFGLVRMVRAVLPGMRVRGAGTVINVGSVAGIVAGAGNGFYAASKFAVEALSEALQAELAPLGVRIVLLVDLLQFHGEGFS